MTHGALFNGIAGFPLAAQWAGIETTWTVEIDEFCNIVSKKHFPHATQYTDIHEAKQLSYVDIISGGFPCQPFSTAGKQLGNEDDRALWPQMLRVIREVRPKYVIGDNVAGIVHMALDGVLASLEAEGYATETFIVPACGVGAPHKRDRVWIVAYSNSGTDRRAPGQYESKGRKERVQQRHEIREPVKPDEVFGVSAHAKGERMQGEKGNLCDADGGQVSGLLSEFNESDNGYATGPRSDFRLTEPPVCGSNDGLPSGLVRNRSKQLKAYGNAIVPQVAYELFMAIIALESVA